MAGEYKVLTKEEYQEWKSCLQGVGDEDIFFTPDYCEIFEKNGEGTPRLFVYQEKEYYICYPFLMNRINDLPVFNGVSFDKDYFDIISPYGYGGPITNVKDSEAKKIMFQNFADVFHEFCLEQGIITEFVRFHPILKNHLDYLAVGPEFNRNTICLDICGGECEVEKLPSKMRNKVKSAVKHGLSVRVGNKGNLKILIRQYHNTMKKNNADDYYFFSEEFFCDIVNILEDRQVVLLEVIHGDKVVASTLFLLYNDYVAYFLTGSESEYLIYRPYNLLMSYAANKFRTEGFKYLHLGGGYTGNDELFRFKKTFTKREPLDFYVGKKIHNLELYQSLTKDLNISGDYFPLYRHPEIRNKSIVKN